MIGVILGTGPSLAQSAPMVRELKKRGARLYGVNNTFRDFDLDSWVACDPAWHAHYGQVTGDFEKWHWDKSICLKYGYMWVKGVWMVDGAAYPRDQYVTPPGPCGGLWLKDKSAISLNHCSAAQALNIAVHDGCDPILLIGHDFHYNGPQRHYFNGLSNECGEYPHYLRKFSAFDKQGFGDDLLAVYKKIADQEGRPNIINCTPGSALPWFPMGELEEWL